MNPDRQERDQLQDPRAMIDRRKLIKTQICFLKFLHQREEEIEGAEEDVKVALCGHLKQACLAWLSESGCHLRP